MKKITLLIMICFVSINLLKAQTTGGPDAYGYIWRNNFDAAGPVYNWIDVAGNEGTQVLGLADDNIVGSFPFSFNFHYYWYDVTQFWIGANGYIGFTSGSLASPFPSIPSPSLPQNYVAAMCSDLVFGLPGDTAKCYRWSNLAHDTLIVSYMNVPYWQAVAPGYYGSNTFQVIFSNIDSSITVQFKDRIGMPAVAAGGYCSMGIENNSGGVGLQQSYNTPPPANYAIKYYYPHSTTFIVNDASTTYNSNPATGGLFLSNNGSPFVMSTSIKNTGNQNLSPFNVYSRVLDDLGAIQASNTVASTSLIPGQSQALTMSSTFNPTIPGTYTYNSTTQLVGDLVPTNDTKIEELVVVDTTVTTMRLSFDNNVEAGLGGLNWTGGNGGAGIYFIPPFYPAVITQLHAYIVTDTIPVGFSMVVYDDSGAGGMPGVLLDSEYVAPGAVTTHSWNTVALATPLTVNSGGVYVAWIMNGDSVTLGQNNVAPFSYRTYEVISNIWATYRYSETQDVMINISMQRFHGAGINEEGIGSEFGEFYPNPTSGTAQLNFSLPAGTQKFSYDIYDVQGKLIQTKNNSKEINSGRLQVNTDLLAPGIYTCKMTADGMNVFRKLVVAK